jgi:hypothetical protein
MVKKYLQKVSIYSYSLSRAIGDQIQKLIWRQTELEII